MYSPKTQSGLTHTCSFFYLQSEQGVIWGSVRAMKKQLGLGQEEGVKKKKKRVSVIQAPGAGGDSECVHQGRGWGTPECVYQGRELGGLVEVGEAQPSNCF